MRLQNPSKSKSSGSEACESTLVIEASKSIYQALKPEAGEGLKSEVELKYRDGKIEIRIKALNISSLQASINAWLRMCKALKKIEEVINW